MQGDLNTNMIQVLVPFWDIDVEDHTALFFMKV